jgi:hypothetical protein
VISDIDLRAIARRAYEIWEREGRPSGQDQRHWFEAERGLAAGAPESDPPAPTPEPDPLAGASDPAPGAGSTQGAPETRQQSDPIGRGG